MSLNDVKNQQKALKQINEIMGEMAKSAENLTKVFEKFNGTVKKNKKATNETSTNLKEAVKSAEGLVKRTKILNTVIEANNGVLALGTKTFNDYRDAGGTAFEYLATFMTSSKEEVRLFGIEAASVRRVLYGFAPRGAFRLINQMAQTFNFLGSAIRAIKDDSEDSEESVGNLTKSLFKMGASISKGMRMSPKQIKEAFGKSDVGEYLRVTRSSPQANMRRNAERELRKVRKLPLTKENLDKQEKLRQRIELAKSMNKAQLANNKTMKVLTSIGESMNGALKMLPKFLMVGLKAFFMGFLYITLFLALIYFIKKTIWPSVKDGITNVLPKLQEIGEVIFQGVGLAFAGIMKIFSAFTEDGSLEDIIDGVLMVAAGILSVAITVLIGAVLGLSAIVISVAIEFFNNFVNWAANTFTNLNTFLSYLPIIAGVIAGIALLFTTAPVWLIGVVVLAVYKVGAWLVRQFTSIVPAFASGGVSAGGMAIVGEKGPELVSLPAGSRVHSNSDSRRMSSSRTVNNVNITINAKDTSDAEMRRIAKSVGRQVMNELSRSKGSTQYVR